MIKIYLSICFLFSLLVSLANDSDTNNYCRLENNSYQGGEIVSFEIGYYLFPLWISAGKVQFRVEEQNYNNRPVYYLKGIGVTYKMYDYLFTVRDTFESYVDRETHVPYKFIRNVSEGGDEIYENVKFNFIDLKAETLKGEVTPITSCTHDVLSAIYHCRNIDFNKYEVNDTIPITLYLDEEIHNVHTTYLGKEEVKTKFGKFRTIKFEMLLIEGTLFEGGGKMTIWVSDDDNRIPLLVESPILIGSVRAEILDYEGVKKEFDSKLK